jgi:hypothetical protein
MWVSENRSPCRSTPTTTGPTLDHESSQRWRRPQLGRAGRDLEEAEGGAEGGESAVGRGTNQQNYGSRKKIIG